MVCVGLIVPLLKIRRIIMLISLGIGNIFDSSRLQLILIEGFDRFRQYFPYRYRKLP
jgi:hypothetical protein